MAHGTMVCGRVPFSPNEKGLNAAKRHKDTSRGSHRKILHAPCGLLVLTECWSMDGASITFSAKELSSDK